MNHNINKPLLILNASAGSGKTYNLVRNYLRLLLKDSPEKSEMSQILAMTFTNKASIEMKNRIIQDLDKLAFGETESTQKFREETAAFIGIQPEHIRKNARTVLKQLLHQYEDFNVLTIDKFNLRLIRSFARDLELPENFEIVIDDDLVLDRAIDLLLSHVDAREKNRIYKLTLRYARENLEEENSWDIKKALKNSSRQLTNERFFKTVKALTENDFKDETLEKWKAQYEHERLMFLDQLQHFRQLFHDQHLEAGNFSNKSTTYNQVVKALQTPVTKRFRITDFSITPATVSHLEKTVDKGLEQTFSAPFLSFLAHFEKNKARWTVEELKIQQFHFLSILRELALIMEDIRNQESLIRVSEFNQLVASLVQNEEAPFIYERLGSRYKHFFLDEFQDTSRLQWMNLIPLVHNSLAQNEFNFIVGDPKQSIYRFKNGVAEQFVALPGIYNPENDPQTQERSSFFEAMGRVNSLDENWRSAQEIVAFNNQLFTELRPNFPDFGKGHYSHIEQIPRGKKGGLVSIELLDIVKNNEETPEDFELDLLLKWVRKSIAEGYNPADICVLGRRKRECNAYALHLRKHGYEVVSSDSLMVNSNETVQLAIQYLQWKADPENIQGQMKFAHAYAAYFFPEESFHLYRNSFLPVQENGKMRQQFSFEAFLKQTAFPQELMQTTYQNIYSLLTVFFRVLKINTLENAYLYQLLDIAYRFDNTFGPELLEFLDYYERYASGTNVVLTETNNSIQIMTAHKSKGLEFPVVLIPSVEFMSARMSDTEHLFEDEDGFFQSKLVQKHKHITAVGQKIEEEEGHAYMDAMNLLYVAFTRAADALYIGGRCKDKLFTKPLFQTLSRMEGARIENDVFLKLERGTLPEREQDRSKTLDPYTSSNLQDFLWFPDISLQASHFEDAHELEDARQIGKLFHAVMENATNPEEAQDSFDILKRKGKLPAHFEEPLLDYVQKAFDNIHFKRILASGKHLNEQTILASEWETFRPDKIICSEEHTIVLDFKTGEPKAKDQQQVQTYVALLQELNMPAVEGYLYYVNGKGLEKVS